jgi:hypothetical protein
VEQLAKPIDVICVCDAGGAIRPLRIRMEDESKEMIRVDIDEILETSFDRRYGAESIFFLCRAFIRGRPRVMEIKYSIRSHCWSILWRFVRN